MRTAAIPEINESTVGPGKDTKSWTYLFYDDADFYNGYEPLYDFALEAYSGDNLNVIVLQDSSSGPAYIWYVDSDHSLVQLKAPGEINMGTPETLQYLIDYGKQNFPADRYFLAMYDHGGGWEGACVDNTDNGWLSMNDIRTAIHDAGRVDILCFTAPCLMGALESVYEMDGLVDVYIGSEELSGFIMWYGVIGPMCDLLNDTVYRTTNEVGQEIVRLVNECTLYPQYKDELTMSAVHVDKAAVLGSKIDALCGHLSVSLQTFLPNLWAARQETHEFGYTNPVTYGSIDLLDFVHEYAARETDPVILNDLEAIELAFAEAVLAECHGINQENAHGLSLYYPRGDQYYNGMYEYSQLDFSDDTDWDLFLTNYFEAIESVEVAYVDDDAPASWYDLTHTRTIGEAIDRVMEGGTVYVSRGVYEEMVTLASAVNLIGEDRELTIIRSDLPIPLHISGEDTLVTGFTVEHTGSDALANVYLVSADHVTITDNIIMNSPARGIRLSTATDCTITRNIIRDCICGISINNTSSGNTFFNNILVNNTSHVLDQGSNTYDQGDLMGGNFWDDYTGADADKDGLGDTPYIIPDAGNEDGFPLMFPYYGLSVDTHTLSASTGGEFVFTPAPGILQANRKFILLGSVTGTAPGLSLPMGLVTPPLNRDVFMDVVIANLNTPLFADFLGALDASDETHATLNTFGPIPSSSVGTRICFAYALYSICDFVSNPVIVEIVN